MLKGIKNINPDQLTDVDALRSAVSVLLNVVEQLAKELEEFRQKNAALQDENNKLKGGNARPPGKATALPSRDISSQGRENTGGKNYKKYTNKAPVGIDREIYVGIEPSTLPGDAVFKGYSQYVQQDVVLKRDNKLFLFETWYSPSLGRTLRAKWPVSEQSGHYGPGVRAFLNVLHHYGDMTQGRVEGLLGSLGIHISGGTVSNLLHREQAWAMAEQRAILQAALWRKGPKQMDTTSNRQKGVHKVTHIITAAFFSVFYTLNHKSRLDCLRALQGNPAEGIRLLWHPAIDVDFQHVGVGAVHCAEIRRLMQDTPCLTLSEFEARMQDQAPHILAKVTVIRSLRDVMAMAYYTQQQDFPRLEVLLSDEAYEYNKIAGHHALCWIHDARYYNKLFPRITLHEQKLEGFKAHYWQFYQKLLDFKEQSAQRQQRLKKRLRTEFDQLFTTKTCYGALDLTIQRTQANKEDLLRVLDFPDLPLHNNAAELAARRVVRKRDISLHTWSDWGTQLRDAFLSIIETAHKLGISAYHFIFDRITQQYKLPSLATIIFPGFTPAF